MLNESDYNEEKSTSQASSLIFLSPFPWIFPLVSLDGRYRERHVANLVSLSFIQTTTRSPNSYHSANYIGWASMDFELS